MGHIPAADDFALQEVRVGVLVRLQEINRLAFVEGQQ